MHIDDLNRLETQMRANGVAPFENNKYVLRVTPADAENLLSAAADPQPFSETEYNAIASASRSIGADYVFRGFVNSFMLFSAKR